MQVRESQAQPLKRSRLEVLDQNIRSLDDLPHPVLPLDRGARSIARDVLFRLTAWK